MPPGSDPPPLPRPLDAVPLSHISACLCQQSCVGALWPRPGQPVPSHPGDINLAVPATIKVGTRADQNPPPPWARKAKTSIKLARSACLSFWPRTHITKRGGNEAHENAGRLFRLRSHVCFCSALSWFSAPHLSSPLTVCIGCVKHLCYAVGKEEPF